MIGNANKYMNEDKNEEVDNEMNKNSMTTNFTDNFDMQTLMNIVGQNAITTRSINQQLGLVVTKVENIESKCNNLEDEIFQIKNNTEITTAQCVQMSTAVARRVYQLFPTTSDKKYRHTTFKRCYSEMQRYHGMGRPYFTTPKCMYQKVINSIEAWVPIGGVDKLRTDVDESQAD